MTTQAAKATMPVDQIRTDGGTQMRTLINETVLAEYAEDMVAGEYFPPVVVFYDGTDYWLGDGFHRIGAAKRLDQTEIAVELRTGTRRDAVLYAVGANKAHGLRRTNEDKRLAITTILRDEEWSQWSDRAIARQCGVDHKTVGALRKELASLSGEIPQMPPERKVRRGEQEYTQKVAAQPDYATIPALEQGVLRWVNQQHVEHLPRQIDELVEVQAWGAQFEQLLASDLLPAPRRKNDVKQAVNNVLAQLRQRLAENYAALEEQKKLSGEFPQITETTPEARIERKVQAYQSGWSLFRLADGRYYATNKRTLEATALYATADARYDAIDNGQHSHDWYQYHDDMATLCSRPVSGRQFKETVVRVPTAQIADALKLVKLEEGGKTRIQALERRLRQLEKAQGNLDVMATDLQQMVAEILTRLESPPQAGESYGQNYHLLFGDDDWVTLQKTGQAVLAKLKALTQETREVSGS